MIEALISGERRGSVMAGLAQTRLRTAGKMADLSMALTGRFTGHHALMCRLHLDRIKIFDDAVAWTPASRPRWPATTGRRSCSRRCPGSGT